MVDKSVRLFLVFLLLLCLVFSAAHSAFVLKFVFSEEYPIKTQCSESDTLLKVIFPALHLSILVLIIILAMVSVASQSFGVSITYLILHWISLVPKVIFIILNWASGSTLGIIIMYVHADFCFENKLFNAVESSMKCCGLKSFEDYVKQDEGIPSSCCSTRKYHCEEVAAMMRPGCHSAILNWYSRKRYLEIEKALYLVSESLWLIAFFAAIVYFYELRKSMKNKEEEQRLANRIAARLRSSEPILPY